MTVVYLILGIVLTAVLFLNIKSAADILCRTVGGVVTLILYSSVFPALPIIGINIVSGAIVGMLGLPGGLLIFCLGMLL